MLNLSFQFPHLSLSRLSDFWLSGVCLPSMDSSGLSSCFASNFSSCFTSSMSRLSDAEAVEATEAAEAGRVWLPDAAGVELSGVLAPERFFTRFGLAPFLLASRSSSVSAENMELMKRLEFDGCYYDFTSIALRHPSLLSLG